MAEDILDLLTGVIMKQMINCTGLGLLLIMSERKTICLIPVLFFLNVRLLTVFQISVAGREGKNISRFVFFSKHMNAACLRFDTDLE